MLIVYDSLTGNVKRFVEKLNMKSVRISEISEVNEPYILITYTINFGEVPESTSEFLKGNNKNLRGVASSGNKNWGSYYAKAGETLAKLYDVPLLLQFELSGNKQDLEKFKQEVSKLDRRTNA